jgi:two-component system OmpR family sensor kinase
VRALRIGSRVPIRLRLTLAFAVAIALVLTALGVFLQNRLEAALDRSIDQGLRGRAGDLRLVVSRAEPGLGAGVNPVLENGAESFAQLLDARGTVVDRTQEAGQFSLLSRAQFALAQRGPILVEREPLVSTDEPVRLFATRATTRAGEPIVVVVGTSLEARGDALESLLVLLLIGAPVALVLASLLGYGLATAALRPVESMRREAAAVSAVEPGRRLSLPAADDEIRRLGATLNEMLGRLELALDRERRFVADASHELRTPLALLRTELELALRSPRTNEELEEAIRSAAEEADRLSQLAEDLLVLAQADEGQLAVRREQTSAAETLGRVCGRFAAKAAGAGRALEIETRPPDLVLFADRPRLEQALGNLVDNALRHGQGKVVVAAARGENEIEVHVRDEGHFPEDLRQHVFERFARSNAARGGSGAGLGLAIVDVIARSHGGSAHLGSGDATDVWFSLPDP